MNSYGSSIATVSIKLNVAGLYTGFWRWVRICRIINLLPLCVVHRCTCRKGCWKRGYHRAATISCRVPSIEDKACALRYNAWERLTTGGRTNNAMDRGGCSLSSISIKLDVAMFWFWGRFWIGSCCSSYRIPLSVVDKCLSVRIGLRVACNVAARSISFSIPTSKRKTCLSRNVTREAHGNSASCYTRNGSRSTNAPLNIKGNGALIWIRVWSWCWGWVRSSWIYCFPHSVIGNACSLCSICWINRWERSRKGRYYGSWISLSWIGKRIPTCEDTTRTNRL